MASSRREEDEHPPFLLRLFYRTGALVKPDDFERAGLPAHVNVYTHLSDTLTDLALSLASEAPHVLPQPAAGTRLVFQLVYHSPPPSGMSDRGGPTPRGPRFTADDLGSVVIGGENTGGMRAYGPKDDGSDDEDEGEHDNDPPASGIAEKSGRGKKERTLADAKLVVGDYVVVAVMPPHEDGTVVSVDSAKRDRDRDRVGRPFGGTFAAPRRGERGGGRGAMMGPLPPVGDWRKGEALPEAWDKSERRRRGRGRW